MNTAEQLTKIANFYDSETERYDEGYSSLACQAEDIFVHSLIAPHLFGNVLDIGAGSGLLCEMQDIEGYVGIDISSKMVKAAKDKFPSKKFAVADMGSLPYANEYFDTVVSLFGPLSYSLTPESLIKEITRVTKPGGHIILMPYTLRVGKNAGIEGYTTATESEIEKIFYSKQSLKSLLSSLDDVRVLGINYFLNSYINLIESIDGNTSIDVNLLVEFLTAEKLLGGFVSAEHARHMIGIGKKKANE